MASKLSSRLAATNPKRDPGATAGVRAQKREGAHLSLWLPEELMDRLDTYRWANQTSKSEVVRQALRDFLDGADA